MTTIAPAISNDATRDSGPGRRTDTELVTGLDAIRDRIFADSGATTIPEVGLPQTDNSAEAISALTHYCVDRIRRAARTDAERVDRLAAAMLDLQQLAMDFYLHAMRRRTERLAGCSAGLHRLQAVPTTSDLLDHLCENVALHCGFQRAVLSRVESGTWKPWKACFRHDSVPDSWFPEWVDRRIPFHEQAPETRLLTDRRASIVYDTENAPVYRPIIVESGRSRSYVVAPLALDNRVVALLHADQSTLPGRIDEVDRDVLWAFTEGVGYIYERTLLMERLRSQRDQIREILSAAVTTMDELCESGINSARSTLVDPDGPEPPSGEHNPAGPAPLVELTAREREVMTLMTTGATNNDIATELVISEGTVKSHVKHILRKLGVANRAQVIAWSMGHRTT